MQFKFTARDVWLSQIADCRAATRSIDLENYIFADSGIGAEFLSILMQRARAGVRVRLLLDMYGSRNLYFNTARIAELRNHGVQVNFFNTISTWRLSNISQWLSRRDHRKFLLVDSRVAHIGSTNVDERMRLWHETNVRIEGDSVVALYPSFDILWHSARMGTLSRKVQRVSLEDDLEYISSTPHIGKRQIHRELLRRIRRAIKSIYIVSPYFIPTKRINIALRRALSRGIKLKIIMTQSPELSKIINLANCEYARALQHRGAEVMIIKTLMHDKFYVIDDKWAMMGSANLDNLSLLSDYEHMLAGEKSDFLKPLLNNFENLSRMSIHLSPQATLRERILGLLTRPIHRFL